jgi:hypothetical protein
VPVGFDVTDGTYPGWCIEDNGQHEYNGPGVILLDSTDAANLDCGANGYPGYPWGSINYLLNHQQGSKKEVQVAMWLLTGYWSGLFSSAVDMSTVNAMVADAEANAGFVPGAGDVVAVILCGDGASGPGSYQDTIIEVPVPGGCTPGYWRQMHHFHAWTGYAPEDNFDLVFGVASSYPDDTLRDAVWKRGGHENALMRHATAALLNASHPGTNYIYTEAEVIAMVQEAYTAPPQFEMFKDMFESANEMGCPLGNGKFSDGFECGSTANWSSVKR